MLNKLFFAAVIILTAAAGMAEAPQV